MNADRTSPPTPDAAGRPVTPPVPPRYWWLKRLSIASGVLLVAIVLLRLWWGYEAERRLQAAIDGYRAEGQPVLPAEFDAILDAVPDDDNAAILYEEAIGKIVTTTNAGVALEQFIDDSDLFDTDPTAATELMQANAALFILIRKARDRSHIAWSERLEGRAARTTDVTIYSGQRMLSRLIVFSTTYHFKAGNHLEAMRTFHDGVAFGDAIAASPTLINSLVAWACQALVLERISELGAELRIADRSQHSLSPEGQADRAEIVSLIGLLLGEEKLKDYSERMFYGERAYQLDFLSAIKQGRISGFVLPSSFLSKLRDFPNEPLRNLDGIRGMEQCTLLARAVRSADCPSALRALPRASDSLSLLGYLARSFSFTWGSPFNRSLVLSYLFLAGRRMAAIALAIRLYEVDHGKRPDALSELVPDYLPQVPLDPLRDDGESILYKPHAEHAILYSVGENGVDDGGVSVLKLDNGKELRRADALFYLDGRPDEDDDAATQGASPQADKDDEDVNDEGGQPDEDQPPKG